MLSSRLLILGSGLLATLAFAGDVAAQKKEPQKASNHQLVQAVHVLQSANLTLAGANHDYGGHRVKAIASVTKAEQELILALQFAKNHKGGKAKDKGGKTKDKGGKGKEKGKAKDKGGKGKGNNPFPEPQAISDAQLHDSIPILRKTVHHLQKANHDYGGHRVAAIANLEEAIHQLHAALKFRKGKG